MTSAVLLLNFGEPTEPNYDTVVEYLTNIFLANHSIDESASNVDPIERSRTLASNRAPELMEMYERIGGSPLHTQATNQAAGLRDELQNRGYEVKTYVAMQYIDPYITDVVETIRNDGVDQLVAIPVYPFCGPSTTVAALEELQDAVHSQSGWSVPINDITGWHRHPLYTRLRADQITTFARHNGVDLHDSETQIVFSAHGTPQFYLTRGSEYVTYVEEYCRVIGKILGLRHYELGFQNHENRDIPWTEPAIEDVITSISADRVIVDSISFMHEQSETLAELDIDLKEIAEKHELTFHRVPLPHNDYRFISVLADLAEPFIAGFDPAYFQLRQCRCKPTAGTVCLNAL